MRRRPLPRLNTALRRRAFARRIARARHDARRILARLQLTLRRRLPALR